MTLSFLLRKNVSGSIYVLKILKKKMKTIIHVNMHVIRRNKKLGTNDPVLTIKQGKLNRYAHEVIICGPSKVIYSPEKPLSCGARVWISTESNVTLVGEGEVPIIPNERTKRHR
jgi:hypothetical protein